MKAKVMIPAVFTALFIAWGTLLNQHLKSALNNSNKDLQNTERSLRSARQSLASSSFRSNTENRDSLREDSPNMEAQRKARERLWTDDKWRAARYSEAYLHIEATFGKFFQALRWPPERIESLKRQMADNQLAVIHAALFEDYDSTGKEVGSSIRDAQIDGAQQMQAVLGPDNYEAYSHFQTMETCKDPVSAIANAMRSQGLEISDELESSLLGTYASATQEAAKQASSDDIIGLDDKQIAALRDQQTNAFRVLLMAKASKLLDQHQLDAFMSVEIEQDSR
jgi:hypothetical protein